MPQQCKAESKSMQLGTPFPMHQKQVYVITNQPQERKYWTASGEWLKGMEEETFREKHAPQCECQS